MGSPNGSPGPDVHPFAAFLQALGRGPGRSRHLTMEEAEEAFALVLAGCVEPEQVGAFLLLLRYRGESPEELAGMVRAARSFAAAPAPGFADLDWPSYAAGRRRGAPWFLLSALLLAQAGVRVLMHGDNAHQGPEAAVEALGLTVAGSADEARAAIAADGFAYLPLRALSPRLYDLMGLRALLGLRTPVNSVLRLLCPSGAPALVEGVFHPPYVDLHAAAAALVGPARVMLFKGGAGEAERNPLKALAVRTVADGRATAADWPAMVGEGRGARPVQAGLDRLLAVWRGEAGDPEGEATVIGTAAVALAAAGRCPDAAGAEGLARSLWEKRRRAGDRRGR